MADEGLDLGGMVALAIGGTIFALISTAVLAFLFGGSSIGLNGAYVGIFLASIFYGFAFDDFISAGITGAVAGLLTGLAEPNVLGWVFGVPTITIEWYVGSHTIMLILLAIIVSCAVSLVFAEG